MYKIITAIGNEFINNELKKCQEYEILFTDIAYQEALVDIAKNKDIDKIILYEDLPGELAKENLFEQLREISTNLDIIVIVDKINDNKKNLLSKYGISKIIDSKELTIELLIENINKEVIKEDKSYIQEQIYNINKTITNNYKYDKKIIAVNGNGGAGKTTFAINLATVLSQNNKKKILVIDLDTVSASVDKFLSIPKINKDIILKLDSDKECVLNYCTEYIQKNMFDFDKFSNLVIKHNKMSNLHIITGNTSMFVCQNILCEEYYNKILEKAKQLYDYIVIDTNNSLFLDATKWALQKSEIIYYLIEGTYKDINNLKNSITVFTKAWDILAEKVKIVLNKTNVYSLNKEYVENLLNMKIDISFEYNNIFYKVSNNGIPVVLVDKNIKRKFEKIIGVESNERFLDKIKLMIGGNS